MVGFKQRASQSNWFANEASVDLKIRERVVQTRSGESPLRYFDGATMKSYRFPMKPIEDAFCLKDPIPESCSDSNGFDGETEDDQFPTSIFVDTTARSVIRDMMKHRASLKIYDGVVRAQELDGVSGLERPGKDGKCVFDPAADRKSRF
jgi:hypothetical protein